MRSMLGAAVLVAVLTAGAVPVAAGPTPASAAEVPHQVAAESPVTAQDLSAPQSNNSPQLAADPTGPSFVVAAARSDGVEVTCRLAVSTDGGRLFAPARPVPQLPRGVDRCYAPQVAFGPKGVLYVAFVGLRGPTNTPTGLYLTRSTDHARSFSAPWPVLGPGNYQARMAIDRSLGQDGRIYLVWLHLTAPPTLGGLPPSDNPLLVTHSDDGGRTFAAPSRVSEVARARSVAPAIAVDGAGSLVVAYYDLGADAVDYQGLEGTSHPGPWSLIVLRSTDGGRTFATVLVQDGIVPTQRVQLIFTMPPPALAVDRGGLIVLAWPDARRGDADVFLRRSADRGASWDPPLRLGDDPAGDRVVQYLPVLAIAPGGRVDAVFYDRRRDRAGVRNDVYLTSSTDRGRSFGANVRLTSESSDSRIGQTYAVASSAGLHEFGSRLGLLSTRSTAVAAWADTRNSPSASIAQDVFAAVVSVAATGQRRQPTILLLPARWGGHTLSWLVGAGLGVAVWAARRCVRRRARRRGDQRRERSSAAASALTRPTRRRQAYPVALLALAAVTVTSCAARVPALAPPVVVRVAMSDDDHGGSAYHVERHVRAGRLVFRVRNDGSNRHELIVLKLPAEPALSLDALVASSSKRAFPTLIALPPIRPGATGTFAIDATPGRYAMLSFVTAHNGLPDYLNGMRAELVVD